jgi:aerotaxis receptor
MEYNSSNFLIETIVPTDTLIVSRTDLKGVLTYANDTFAQISGYEIDELIGQSHNCVRHPDMPKSVFTELWNDLQTKGKWSGFVKNLRKDQGFYWVFAEVSGVYKNNELIEYKSVRTPVSFEDKIKYQEQYDAMKQRNGEQVRTVSYSEYKE